MKQAILYILALFFLFFAGRESASAQFRSGSGTQITEIKSSTTTTAAYNPGLNVRRVGAFGGLVQNYHMNHSVEMSMATAGGQYAARNLYTNTQMFQFSNTLSARFDIGVSQTPFSNMPIMAGQQQPQIFLRNASIDYRPNSKMSFHISFSQDPSYGRIFNNQGRFQPNGGF